MNDDEEIDRLLRELLNDTGNVETTNDLRELFENKIQNLGIKTYHVLDRLNIALRTLNGILDGTQKSVNIISLIKLARFLELEDAEIYKRYVLKLQFNFPNEFDNLPISSNEKSFILDNFDLEFYSELGIIEDIKDFESINKSLKNFYGFNNIYDYSPPSKRVAYSSSERTPKSPLTRSNWEYTTERIFSYINNSNPYNRQELIEFFPEIRPYTQDVPNGLLNVIKRLFEFGVTVLFYNSKKPIHLRGITYSIHGKPVIALNDLSGNYATLWFALIHELYHVLFDWDEITTGVRYRSYEEREVIDESEENANDFARKYLFSKEKSKSIVRHIKNKVAVEKYAKLNDVHPSIIYTFNAFDQKDSFSWSLAKKNNPSFKDLSRTFSLDKIGKLDITTYAETLLNNLYNHEKQ